MQYVQIRGGENISSSLKGLSYLIFDMKISSKCHNESYRSEFPPRCGEGNPTLGGSIPHAVGEFRVYGSTQIGHQGLQGF